MITFGYKIVLQVVKDHTPVVNCVSLALLLIVFEIQPAIYPFNKLKLLTLDEIKVDVGRYFSTLMQ